MEAIFVLVPVSVIIIFVVIVTFIWSVNHHQFDDLEKEAERILFEDQDSE